MPTTVVNVRQDYFDVYIGRDTSYGTAREHQNRSPNLEFGKVGSLGKQGYFGNPIAFGKECEVCGNRHFDTEQGRKELLACYKKWFWRKVNNDQKFREAIKKLEGHRLGCFCHPKACHGDVIAAYLEAGCPLLEAK